MSFLVTKLFAYLAVALAAGMASGWMLRARRKAAVRTEAPEMVELAGRIDLLEGTLEQRNQELAAAEERLAQQCDDSPLQDELNARNHRISQLEEQVRELSVEMADHVASGVEETDSLITALHSEIARLRDELAKHETGPGRSADDLNRSVKELEARLVRKAGELDRLEQALSREERKVRELERERELQNKSLHVLHQQLELERERGPQTALG